MARRVHRESQWLSEASRTNLWLVPSAETPAASALFVITRAVDSAACYRGNQWTLGTFVATLVYAMLDLVAVGTGPKGDFVPHVSITVVLLLTVVDIGVLIYFIHHVALMIQLPQVIAGIAHDLTQAVDQETASSGGRRTPPPAHEFERPAAMVECAGGVVAAPESGYLQIVRRSMLADLAVEHDAVIRCITGPGTSWWPGCRS
jgi:uncharacterized membrane protein